MQLLLIKLKDHNATPEYALLGKKQAEDRFTPADWKRVRSLCRGRKVVLLIPKSDATLSSVQIPSKNKKQLLQATPYALEDTLAEDIDDLHFAIHQESGNKETHVAIINRKTLDAYLRLLKTNGISPHFALPQILAQPIPKDGWSIIQSGKTVDVRFNIFNGFSSNNSLLETFLIDQLDEQTPEKIYSNIDAENLPETLQAIPLEKLEAGTVEFKTVEPALALNLITGFVSQKKSSTGNLKAWRATLILASLVAGIGLGIFTWQSNGLKQQSKQLDKVIVKIFTSTFPNSRVVNAPQQMANKLAQLKNNAGKITNSPLPLIAEISPIIKQFKNLKLNEVHYQDETLELIMQSPNLARLSAFKKEAAKKAKLNVKIKSSNTTANEVKATLIISPLSALSVPQQVRT